MWRHLAQAEHSIKDRQKIKLNTHEHPIFLQLRLTSFNNSNISLQLV